MLFRLATSPKQKKKSSYSGEMIMIIRYSGKCLRDYIILVFCFSIMDCGNFGIVYIRRSARVAGKKVIGPPMQNTREKTSDIPAA